MRINTKTMLGQDVTLYTTFNKPKISLVLGMFLVSLFLVGHEGFGLASTVIGPLQIHQESVTGSVSQWPLGLILDQFQKQLGIEYKAPKEELEQPVSVDLHGESLPQALAKILAQWDYALKIDPAGNVQEIFVVKKNPAEWPGEKTLKTKDSQSDFSNYSEVDKRTREFMGGPQGTVMDETHVESPTFETSHPVIPQEPSHQDRRKLQDALDEAGMGILPPPDSPEMEVKQVSEEEQQAILQSLNPAPMGSLERAGYPDMNIAPVSEEEAQEILRSLNQSIGRSRDASPP